jgi:hypothetical protein
MKKLSISLFCLALCLLCACGEAVPEELSVATTTQAATMHATTTEAPTTQAAIPPFLDLGIAQAAKSALGKEADDNAFSASELDRMSQFISLHIYDGFRSLADLPVLFPKLRYLGLMEYGGSSLSQQEQSFIAGLGLKALTIYARTPVMPELFADLPYLNIRLGERLYGDNADSYENPVDLMLEQHSVLGAQYIRDHTIGKLIEYVRVIYDGRVYELFVGRHEMEGQGNAWLFISEKDEAGLCLCGFL